MRELDVTGLLLGTPGPGDLVQLGDALDAASDQNQGTWLLDGGRRIAAIVPVDVAEYAERIDRLATGIRGDRDRGDQRGRAGRRG